MKVNVVRSIQFHFHQKYVCLIFQNSKSHRRIDFNGNSHFGCCFVAFFFHLAMIIARAYRWRQSNNLATLSLTICIKYWNRMLFPNNTQVSIFLFQTFLYCITISIYLHHYSIQIIKWNKIKAVKSGVRLCAWKLLGAREGDSNYTNTWTCCNQQI